MTKLKGVGLLVLCGFLALPLLGQGPRPRRGGAQGEGFGDDLRRSESFLLGRLTDALDLTVAQQESLEALFQQRQSMREQFREELMAAQEALERAIEGGDPTEIGNAFLARRALEQRQDQMNEDLMSQFRSLLTLDQQEQLDALESFGGVRPFGPLHNGPGPRFPPPRP